jgi:hypothetical protein
MVWQVAKARHKAFLMVTKETATMTTISESISIPETPNVFIYRGERKHEIPRDVTRGDRKHGV